MTPKFRAWLKEEYRMTDVNEITFFNDEVQMISGVEDFYAYDEFELMQSTGLFDKNGEKIFEGDVVKCYTVTENGEHEYVGVVCFKDFAFVIVDEKDTYDPLWNYKSGFVGIETEIEIIGNIYQNPGLLGG